MVDFLRSSLPVRTLMALTLVVPLAGCGIGPTLKQSVTLPSVNASLAGKEIVVSGFRASSHSVSVTSSGNIRETLESVRVGDISAEVAQSLVSQGVPAEARIDFKPSYLRQDQLMLRGAVVTGKGHETGLSYLNLIIWPFSLMVIGGVVPTPIAFEKIHDVEYRMELIDSEGRVVLNVNDVRESSIKDYYAWPAFADQSHRSRECLGHAKGEIFRELAEVLRTAGADVASLPVERPVETTTAAVRSSDAWLSAERLASQAEQLIAEDPALAETKALEALTSAERALKREHPDLIPFLVLLSNAQFQARMRSIDAGAAGSSTDVMTMLEEPRANLARAYRISLNHLGPDDPLTQRVGRRLLTEYGEDGMRIALGG